MEGLTIKELMYLEACMQVADGDGEHAAEYGLDCGALQVKLQQIIGVLKDVEEQAATWRDAEERGMKEHESSLTAKLAPRK